MKKELKDKSTGFYKYKTLKIEKGGYKNKITTDDVVWYLGDFWKLETDFWSAGKDFWKLEKDFWKLETSL